MHDETTWSFRFHRNYALTNLKQCEILEMAAVTSSYNITLGVCQTRCSWRTVMELVINMSHVLSGHSSVSQAHCFSGCFPRFVWFYVVLSLWLSCVYFMNFYHRSYIHNLSSCEIKAWKKFRPERDSNPWPLRYRCSALPTELSSHLGAGHFVSS